MKNVWTKTILTVYRYLDRIAGAIDKLVDRQAMNSYYSAYTNSGVIDIADEIIKLSERKVKLINLKALTLEALKNIDMQFAQLLIEKYIDGDGCEEIAKRHNLCTRTYFRRLEQAEDNFINYFSMQGFGEKKLYEYLKGEAWIMEVQRKFKAKKMIEMQEEQDEIRECV